MRFAAIIVCWVVQTVIIVHRGVRGQPVITGTGAWMCWEAATAAGQLD